MKHFETQKFFNVEVTLWKTSKRDILEIDNNFENKNHLNRFQIKMLIFVLTHVAIIL